MQQLIVCAAIQHKDTGLVLCGPRHGDCLNTAAALGFPTFDTWKLGFVDQDNVFYSRLDAWTIADKAGQIRRPTGWEHDYGKSRQANIGDDGLLFSENLY